MYQFCCPSIILSVEVVTQPQMSRLNGDEGLRSWGLKQFDVFFTYTQIKIKHKYFCTLLKLDLNSVNVNPGNTSNMHITQHAVSNSVIFTNTHRKTPSRGLIGGHSVLTAD